MVPTVKCCCSHLQGNVHSWSLARLQHCSVRRRRPRLPFPTSVPSTFAIAILGFLNLGLGK